MSRYPVIKKRIDKRIIVVEGEQSCGFLLGGKKRRKYRAELLRYDINSCNTDKY
jgi:hypothetical protein